jgi:ribosomal protein L12E/L44/L45/RPP1/RPP2
MISLVLTYGGNRAPLEELLKPDAAAGVEPEQREIEALVVDLEQKTR